MALEFVNMEFWDEERTSWATLRRGHDEGADGRDRVRRGQDAARQAVAAGGAEGVPGARADRAADPGQGSEGSRRRVGRQRWQRWWR